MWRNHSLSYLNSKVFTSLCIDLEYVMPHNLKRFYEAMKRKVAEEDRRE